MPSVPRLMPALAGFLLMGGLLPVGIVTVYILPSQPLPWASEETPVPEEAPALARIYVEMPDPLMVSLGDSAGTMHVNLAAVVEGPPLDLLELEKKVEAQAAALNAAMLAEAQLIVSDGAKTVDVHAILPERVRTVINGIIGTESWPEPVQEVIVTALMMQQSGT